MIKKLLNSIVTSFALPYAMITGNTRLLEAICFGHDTPTIHNDPSTFEKEVEKSKEDIEKQLEIKVDIEDFDNIFGLCGIQPIKGDIGRIFVLQGVIDEDSEEDEAFRSMSMEIVENAISPTATSLDNKIWNDIAETVKEVSEKIEVDISEYKTEDYKFADTADKFIAVNMEKVCNNIAFVTRRGKGNTIVISKEDSMFEDALYHGLLARAIVSKSDKVAPNEAIIGYRGTNDVDCGAMFVPTEKSEDGRMKYALQVRSEFFTTLTLV